MTGITPDAIPAIGDVAGHSVTLSYGDVAAEYAALRGGVAAVDRSARARMLLEGRSAAEALTGLVTNDVAGLAAGEGAYAAALTPKGRIIADPHIFRVNDESYLIDVPARAAGGWKEMIRKYVNPRLARPSDVSADMRQVTVCGPQARRVVDAVTGLGVPCLGDLAMHAHRSVNLGGQPGRLARVPDVAVDAFALFVAASAFEELWRALHDAGAIPAGLEAWDIARVEAGRPEWGIDIDESTIPQEANLDQLHAISFTKGCYTGQEVVARIHFRGHVNRHLRGLRWTDAAPLPEGATLHNADDKPVGDVRSSVYSPRLGPIALAMVRREVNAGDSVTVRWDGGDAAAEVVTLPFA